MSTINEVLIAVIGLINELSPYATATIGALPADNGISCYIATGSPETTFMTKGMAYQMTVTLNGKHTNQQTVSDTLNNIHKSLTQKKSYPQTDDYQITDIGTVSSPNYIERDANRQYLYGSALQIKFFLK